MISNHEYKGKKHWNTKLDKYTNGGVARGKKKKPINKSDRFFDPMNFTATQVLGWYKGMTGERDWE